MISFFFSCVGYQPTSPTSPQNYNYEPQPARSAAAPPPPSGGVRNCTTSISTRNVNTLKDLYEKWFYMVNCSSAALIIYSFIHLQYPFYPGQWHNGSRACPWNTGCETGTNCRAPCIHTFTNSFTNNNISSAQEPVPLIGSNFVNRALHLFFPDKIDLRTSVKTKHV